MDTPLLDGIRKEAVVSSTDIYRRYLAKEIAEDPTKGTSADAKSILRKLQFTGISKGFGKDGPSLMFNLPQEYYGDHGLSVYLDRKGVPQGWTVGG